jgi:hypothetical protein
MQFCWDAEIQEPPGFTSPMDRERKKLVTSVLAGGRKGRSTRDGFQRLEIA